MSDSIKLVLFILAGVYLAAISIPLLLIKLGVIGGKEGLFLIEMDEETSEKVRYVLKDILYSSILIVFIGIVLLHAYTSLPLWEFIACLVWVMLFYAVIFR